MVTESTVARAFELAREGTCRSVDDVRKQLKLEGYGNAEAHLAGSSIKKQLIALMKR
jgi:hypothetical protein